MLFVLCYLAAKETGCIRIHLELRCSPHVANPEDMAWFFIEAQMVNILGSEGLMISVTIIRLPLWHKGSYSKYVTGFVNGCAYVAIKPYLQKAQ